MKLRHQRKRIQEKLGWPDTKSGRTSRRGERDYDPFTGEPLKRYPTFKWSLSSWNKAWRGAAE